MNTNEIKQKLYNYTYIQCKIDAINEDLCNLAEVIDNQRNVKCPILTGLPGGNNISDPVAEAAEKIIDKYCSEYARYENELDRLFKEKHQVEDMLSILDNTERRIIELKFFKKYRWWMVADTMNYSEKQCRRISNIALNKISNKANGP